MFVPKDSGRAALRRVRQARGPDDAGPSRVLLHVQDQLAASLYGAGDDEILVLD